MISENISKELENVSTVRNQNKILGFEKKVGRTKLNALGDVQNTLHFRSSSFLGPTNAVKSSHHGKFSNISKLIIGESEQKKSKPKQEPIYSTEIESVDQDSNDTCDDFETHNHALCEQEDKDSVDDLFLEYKLSEIQIEKLVKSVKKFRYITPLTQMEFSAPCEDIELPAKEEMIEKSISVNDSFNDFDLSSIPPPIEVL